MGQTSFDLLLKRMSEIAGAVNAFSSEAVQEQAFAALVQAFNSELGSVDASLTRKRESQTPPTVQHGGSAGQEDTPEARTKRGKRREGNPAAKIEIIKDLDLRPKGKISFVEFIGQKRPKTNEDKYVVAVYYLEQILGVTAVTESHVATVFRLTQDWREPENLPAGLRMAASRKATIDTSDRNAIKTTPHGRNFVEHDLPASTEGQ
ncbi:MAG: hypothetical protein JSR72_15330 [Proteobacteria bacterium]|nr:hypothetical protein [Pseudomonadota bacterium]